MKLFRITDEETVHIVAETHADAIDHWRTVISERRDCDIVEIDGPEQVFMLAAGDDVVLTPGIMAWASANDESHKKVIGYAVARKCLSCGWLMDDGGCNRPNKSNQRCATVEGNPHWKPREEEKQGD
jgi:hypothetical protein